MLVFSAIFPVTWESRAGLVLLLPLLLAACAGTVRPVPEQAPSLSGETVQVGLIESAGYLFAQGQRRGDGATMAIAAELRADALGGWRTKDDVEGGVLSPEAMLEAAERVAGSDVIARAMVQRVRDRRTRGRADGPLVRHLEVSGGAPHRVEIDFEADRPAIIYVEAPGRAHVALTVRDSAQTVICQLVDDRPRKICRWMPAAREDHEIEISNPKAEPVEILLITN